MPVINNIPADQSSAGLSQVPALPFFVEKLVNFADTGLAMAAADTMDLFVVPAGTLVLGAKLEMLTADSAATTADLGVTGGTVDLFINGAAMNALGVTTSGSTGTGGMAATGGTYFAADTTISLLAITNGLSDGVMRLQLFGFDLSSRLADPA